MLFRSRVSRALFQPRQPNAPFASPCHFWFLTSLSNPSNGFFSWLLLSFSTAFPCAFTAAADVTGAVLVDASAPLALAADTGRALTRLAASRVLASSEDGRAESFDDLAWWTRLAVPEDEGGGNVRRRELGERGEAR